MNLTLSDWIAIAIVALPLIAKVLTDYSTALDQAHTNALGRIEGMAGRLAADIARRLQELPAGANAKEVETRLIGAAVADMTAEMTNSITRAGGDPGKVAAIVTSELNKLLVSAPKPSAPPVTASIGRVPA